MIVAAPRRQTAAGSSGRAWLGRPRTVAPDLSEEAIEAIATRVAELLRAREACGRGALVDAATVAQRFGLSRAWVYQHARELGAIALGTGERPRLRFDLDVVEATLSRRRSNDPPPTVGPAINSPRGRPRRDADTAVPLLPIRGAHGRGGVRSIFAKLHLGR